MTAATESGRGSDVSLQALSSILVHGPISRTELTSRLDVSLSTMTRAVRPLLDLDLVHETSEPLEGPGRPTKPLVGTPGSRRFVGAKLTGSEVYAVATDILARETAHASRTLDDTAPDAVAGVVAELVRELVPGPELVAVGVALGGSAVDGRTVSRAPFLDWRDVPLADLLEPQVGVPVVVDNDVAALTAGEHWFGVARGEPDFAVVTLGAGVGLGLVRNDRVVRITDMGLGTAGHIPLDPTGPRCPLGHRGCSTALLTSPSMAAQASVALQRDVDFAEVIRLAADGEPVCHAIVTAAAEGLGRLVALVTNLAMVEVVVLSGDGLAVLDIGEATMRERLRLDRDVEASDLDIRIDRDGFARWAHGAATVAIQWSLPGLLTA